ncbi:MAG: hypothetical protein ACOCRK_00080 [bacterium]
MKYISSFDDILKLERKISKSSSSFPLMNIRGKHKNIENYASIIKNIKNRYGKIIVFMNELSVNINRHLLGYDTVENIFTADEREYEVFLKALHEYIDVNNEIDYFVILRMKDISNNFFNETKELINENYEIIKDVYKYFRLPREMVIKSIQFSVYNPLKYGNVSPVIQPDMFLSLLMFRKFLPSQAHKSFNNLNSLYSSLFQDYIILLNFDKKMKWNNIYYNGVPEISKNILFNYIYNNKVKKLSKKDILDIINVDMYDKKNINIIDLSEIEELEKTNDNCAVVIKGISDYSILYIIEGCPAY